MVEIVLMLTLGFAIGLVCGAMWIVSFFTSRQLKRHKIGSLLIFEQEYEKPTIMMAVDEKIGSQQNWIDDLKRQSYIILTVDDQTQK